MCNLVSVTKEEIIVSKEGTWVILYETGFVSNGDPGRQIKPAIRRRNETGLRKYDDARE